ncbi:hypothetical protein SeMB42_g01431 [Synchytrium endobioticum]|uniref:UBA domain-containing protein n=1 Tax=Synchytrium endobioticum TaxID=286115 RepID=A0A507DMI6_9FUNG|nr:hypothetical protein SeLEV6574_g00524 [Synchytrium endobioticum]TPX52445.1 hypothetical protein SeMB42_g01431 [Synchytrium endobioticum]
MSFSVTYPPLADVPLIVNVRKPNPISLPVNHYHPITFAEIDSLNYDFSLESAILDDSIKHATLEAAHQQAEHARRIQAENETRARTIRETQRRAPGLNLEGEILQPMPSSCAAAALALAIAGRSSSVDSLGCSSSNADGANNDGNTVVPTLSPPIGASDAESGSGPLNTEKASRKPTNFSLLDFEHGLAPPDPWDLVKKTDEELSDLNTVFGGSARPSSANNTGGRLYAPLSQSPSPSTDASSPPRFSTNPRIPTPQPASNTHGGIPTPFHRAQQQAYELNSGMSNMSISASPNQHVAPPPKPPKPSAVYASPSPHVPGPKPLNYGTNTGTGSPRRPESPLPAVNAGAQAPTGLSPGMQELYVKMVNMGFAPSAIERAFRVHGSDEKRVLDFLVPYTEYLSRGFKSENIEVALSLYDSAKDPEKCVKFLSAFSALAEMGFSTAKIKEVLVLKGLDQEQAMEFLLSEGGGF